MSKLSEEYVNENGEVAKGETPSGVIGAKISWGCEKRNHANKGPEGLGSTGAGREHG